MNERGREELSGSRNRGSAYRMSRNRESTYRMGGDMESAYRMSGGREPAYGKRWIWESVYRMRNDNGNRESAYRKS